jgi:hypothetical protein
VSKVFDTFFESIAYSRSSASIWFSSSLRLTGVIDFDLKSRRHLFVFDSKLIQQFPTILSDFDRKYLTLLYRGSRDGFECSSFHARCDGRSHTITIVETTRGFVFGGYTPLAWDSSNTNKQDDSMQSFIFTIRNAANTDPRQFSLKPEQKHYAIQGHSSYGPIFGGGCDFYLCYKGNPSKPNHTNFGHSYMNDTGQNANTFLAGEQQFAVKELEVFEVRD